VGTLIAYAYLRSALAEPGTSCQVEVFGERVPATVATEPLWDPTGNGSEPDRTRRPARVPDPSARKIEPPLEHPLAVRADRRPLDAEFLHELRKRARTEHALEVLRVRGHGRPL
jgi:Glycine cleavage T-protein C-terminal barrel domain